MGEDSETEGESEARDSSLVIEGSVC